MMNQTPVRHLPIVESRAAIYDALPLRPQNFAGVDALVDPQGRHYDYLRLSVTDRCDLACIYCMPPGGEDEHAIRCELLSFEEAARLVTVFAGMGIRRVRLTGGEPLVRKDIVRLTELLCRRSGIDELVMTTNATRLAELAKPLAQAGLRGVNVSIDSLDPQRFFKITRGGDLRRVVAGIHAALDAGLEVKLNTVLLRHETLDEAAGIVDYAWSIGVTPRFIELMPLGEGAKLPLESRVPASEVIELLGDRLIPGNGEGDVGRGPARYLQAANGSQNRVGFITPMSDEFCGQCNRVRVNARGDIRACLASRRAVNLRDIMRAEQGDLDLAWAIYWSLCGKRDGHFFLDSNVDEHTHVGMSLIGG